MQSRITGTTHLTQVDIKVAKEIATPLDVPQARKYQIPGNIITRDASCIEYEGKAWNLKKSCHRHKTVNVP